MSPIGITTVGRYLDLRLADLQARSTATNAVVMPAAPTNIFARRLAMKKLITAAIAATSLVAALALARSWNNGWVQITSNPDGTSFYIRKRDWIGQYRVAEIRVHWGADHPRNSASNSGKGIYSDAVTLGRALYDCSNGRVRLSDLRSSTTWQSISPGTALYATYRHTCSWPPPLSNTHP